MNLWNVVRTHRLGSVCALAAIVGIAVMVWRWSATVPLPAGPTDSGLSDSESRTEPEGSTVVFLPRERWAAAEIQLEPATVGPIAKMLELTGKIALNEDNLAHIYPLVEGRVDEVRVRFGQKVRKGDLLVVVQSREVGHAMLQLFQDRLALQFVELKDRWTQDYTSHCRGSVGSGKVAGMG